ncbi:uncharacterized protein LOC142550684 [Primulina tabacum]|uniref:uncharacterized protein LOC142550684 n=1 Tax=Primulina tabacum TaxID=48773 RepID=UPI003F5958A8
MLSLICRRNLGSLSKPYLLQFPSFSSLINSSTPDFDSGNGNGDPFATSYLIERFGFSRERAIKAYALVKFRSSEKPNSVIAFFKEHGFSDAQIKRIVEKGPLVLKLKPRDSLLPKIEFFRSLGISDGDIVKIITTAGFIMTRSLENRIALTFEFVKNMLKSEKDAIQAIKRFPSILSQNLKKNVPLNAEMLREAGVPEINVVYLFKRHPRSLISSPDEFKKQVERVTELGFSPLTTIFILGVIAMRMLPKLSWNKKMDIYKRWGYSEDQLLIAFRRFPQCMVTSEEKINGVLGHIINKMGWDLGSFSLYW